MFSTGTLGILFVVIGLAAMFLMYHLWGYPFDKATRTSAAPAWARWTHRVLGYLFALIYIALMWQMVPRLWEYQVEFPARTTAHIILGFTIGFLLLIKISIMRFFRHFEEWMPYLGTAIMLGTVILLGLSLPYALQERALAKEAFSEASRARVAQLLPGAGLPAEAPLAELSTVGALAGGRRVLLESCVKCHDLKTILAKPRTPSGWWSTIERMAEKPALFDPMTDRDMYEVTAYLVAITPDLQRASKLRHRQEVAREDAMAEGLAASSPAPVAPVPAPAVPAPAAGSAAPPATPAPRPEPQVDLALAKRTYETACSQCHELSDIDKAPPKTRAESRLMIQRMIRENEAELSPTEIKLIAAWLDAEFVDKRK